MKSKLWILPLFFFASTMMAATYNGPPPSPPTHEVAGKIPEKMTRNITPDAGPRVDHGIDVFITADFIYWTARMDGLEYVASGVASDFSGTSKGTVYTPDWDWDPGFKVGIGLNLPHDGWDVYAEYTWLHSSASDTVRGINLAPAWNIAALIETVSRLVNDSHANWDVHFNAIDLSLGRNYFVSQFLSLRPFIGFKGSWIDQDYHVRYNVDRNGYVSTFRLCDDQDFWGIGLRTGLDTSWHINKWLSFYGDCALTALWSQFDVDRKDTRNDSQNPGGPNNPPLNTNITIIDTENKFHTIKGVLEFGLGLRGEWWFMEDRYHFLIQAGWEEQVWINFNNLIKGQNDLFQGGDLILQGLTIKTRFDF